MRADGLAVLAILVGMVTTPAAALEPARLVAGFPRGQLVLDTAGPRCLLIDTWFPGAPEQRAQGLMFVESLGEFEGMYFGSAAPAELVMWMKNTRLSLDMVFVRADGTVGRIAADTEPYSTRHIPSEGAVIGVLELNAGFARRWRVVAGTRVRSP
jgi:uncharacterized membrane protein (UPF0127 family)